MYYKEYLFLSFFAHNNELHTNLVKKCSFYAL